MNKILSILLAVTLFITLLLTGCGGGTVSQAESGNTQGALPTDGAGVQNSGKAEYVIKVSSVLAESNPNCQGLYKFEEYLEKKSGGRIDVQVYPGGILATSDEINVELVMTGGCEMAVSPAYCLAQKANTPEFDVSIYPFLSSVPDKRVYYELMNKSDVIAGITERFEAETDVKICGYYDIGWIDIGNKIRPFTDVNSGRGLKMRSAVAPIWKDTLETFGPSAVPMAYGEVFGALQQGTIDGVVSSTPCFVSDLFYEELNYITLTHHVLVMYGIYVNETFFNSLPEDLQGMYLDACEYLIEVNDELFTAAEQESIDTMEASGIEIYTLSQEDRSAWAELAQQAIEANVNAIGRDFYDRVKEEVARIETELGL